ncbi:restriction endonuclease subunit S [Streptomyces sp. APSN-46.1]|uniref:restriction endonuclease subunit S n=1 Tax=Streptomyces sp. APSN-46.1 TaxID=2929049 RepID=UPI001FB4857D|nr:restriction endonuclease subunit S [Streptomyces sp. APSN-46.1]MCJ1680778.1 restriction endonuclease subunit S [Streptomyces sp. APSN-46.1]
MSKSSGMKLPTGWIRTSLANVGDVVSGATPKTSVTEYWDGDIPWITPDDLSKNPAKRTRAGRRSLTQVGYDSCSTRMVERGSVLFSSRAPIGYVTIADNALCTNQGFKTVVPTSAVSSDYLYWYLQYKTSDITAEASGTTFKEISGRKFAETELLLPPVAEQHRIVDALEDHLSRLDAACAALQRSLSRTSSLRQAAISRILRGERVPLRLDEGTAEDLNPQTRLPRQDHPWNIPDGWIWTTIGGLFSVRVGTTPSRKNPDLWSGCIPWVSSGEVNFRRIANTREHITEEAVGNKRTRLHPAGTVMIAMIGEGKTRGQVAILDIEATHNQNCASIRVSETQILPEYIYLVLEQRYLESRRASSGGNQPALNKAKVEAIPVPLPPLATQRRIVAEADEFGEVIKHLRAELETTLKRAANLRQSVLSHAFSGKLAAQDRADEPASALLERIRAEREAQGGGKAKRATRRPRKQAVNVAAPPPPTTTTPVPTTAVQQELPL